MSPSPPHRRLSVRRGSTSAPDPFGVHATVNLNPNRSSSSTLTIVRVPSAPPVIALPVPPSLNEPPASPVLSQRRLHRRISQTTPGGPAPPSEPANTRVSFAFSSFGGGPAARPSSPSRSHPPSPSPSSSPRLRPSSPHLTASSSSFGGKPRLTPDQLVDLARQSTIPRPLIPPTSDLSSPPVPHTLPATFTPLPDDIYLPFIDRPSEVAALISSPPDLKLFSLLAQTFRPKFPTQTQTSDPLSAATLPSDNKPVDLPRDPAQWSYSQLVYHLTKIDRDIAPDFIWAIAARKCILSHSELIWERIKGALGIPPELDVDYDFLDDDQESPDTSDISDDEGRGPRGHWSDWDAVMDSPVYARNMKRLSVESPAASIYSTKREDPEALFRAHIDESLRGLQDSGYLPSAATTTTNDASPSGGEDTGPATIVRSTPHAHGARSPELQDQGGVVYGTFSPPPLITQREPTQDTISGDYLSIEPLLAPATSPSNSFGSVSANPPPMSLPSSGDGLGDIAEGAEEEETEPETTTTTTAASTEPTTATATESTEHLIPSGSGPTEETLIAPSQIQGLRISTSPLPPSFGSTPPQMLSPISPLPPYPPPTSHSHPHSRSGSISGGTQPQAIPSSGSYTNANTSTSTEHSRTSSFSSIGPFQRSESTGNLAASWSALAAAAAGSGGGGGGAGGLGMGGSYGGPTGGGGSQYASSVIGSDAGDSSGYASDGDRMPGNPLFPSNFARLTGGPSMRAK
ncbi:hypothetical protein BDZ97DRAFT_501229 [Flammula alnicola]|nr:hypothetical protein BDZ97DRAFT_501229 [Flammula alnicola]